MTYGPRGISNHGDVSRGKVSRGIRNRASHTFSLHRQTRDEDSVALKLVHRLRRCANKKTTLGQCVVFAGSLESDLQTFQDRCLGLWGFRSVISVKYTILLLQTDRLISY